MRRSRYYESGKLGKYPGNVTCRKSHGIFIIRGMITPGQEEQDDHGRYLFPGSGYGI